MDAVEFGADYPNLVAGAVLLDPSSPAALTNAAIAVGIAPDAAAAEMRAIKRWPPVPLVVLTQDLTKGVATGVWTPARARAWSDWHRRYARLTPQGIEQEVPGATHNDFVITGVAAKPVLAAIRRVIRDSH
jgi:pimeloyl-ACP methyl ester carboxylesterase